jgi:hypothetical protein
VRFLTGCSTGLASAGDNSGDAGKTAPDRELQPTAELP